MQIEADHFRMPAKQAFLRPVTYEDCTERYVGWLNDPVVNRYLEVRWEPQTLGSLRSFIGACIRDPNTHLLAICDADRGMQIGTIKIGPIHPRHRYADVGYMIGERDMWNRGIATDAIWSATWLAFNVYGVRRCQAGAYAKNVGSIRALEKAGYIREGIERRKMWSGNLGYCDRVCMAALADEWVVDKTD